MNKLTLVLVLIAVPAWAQGSRISSNSINCGGGTVQDASYKITYSIGQGTVGLACGSTVYEWVGMLAGEFPIPTAVASIGSAKKLPDGTFISLPGMIAASDSGDFWDYLFIEDAGRTSGIGVRVQSEMVPGLVRGSVVNVVGTLTGSSGTRSLVSPIVTVVGSHAPLRPLYMSNRSLGGKDLGVPPLGQYGVAGATSINNIGLLVRIAGRVTAVGPYWVIIDDGSQTSVIVDTTVGYNATKGGYIAVTGISALSMAGTTGYRRLLPRQPSDFWP